MSYTVQLDEKCRIPLPAGLRESLHLAPGSHVRLDESADAAGLVVSSRTEAADEPHLIWEDGLPVIAGDSADFDTVQQIRWMRAERDAHVLGLGYTAEELIAADRELE